METIFIELSQEEVEAVFEAREKQARKEEIKRNFETIKECLHAIEDLGGSIHLPPVGGKYVSRYSPRVSAMNIEWTMGI